MAIRRATLLLLLCSSMSILMLPATEAEDEDALIAFKAATTSDGGYGDTLASWNGSSAGFCSWEGVTCGLRNRRVVALSLPSHGLTGILSPAVGNLTFLRTLHLGSNSFTGAIPASLGRLRRLQTLNLSHNAFSGEIPANLSSCTSLKVMALRFNQLHGWPSELGSKLTRLSFLSLGNNSFTGAIPASLANLSSLSSLYMSFNQLEGTIPAALLGIPGLKSLALAFNSLSGELPRTPQNLSSLEMLQVQGNMLHGSIPSDIGTKFPNMLDLLLYENQLTGSIPASLSNLTKLRQLDLSLNRLSGYVPPNLGSLRALQSLQFYSNNLEARSREEWEFISSLSNCSQLLVLAIGMNTGLAGQLPSSIVNLSATLQWLILRHTSVTGSITSTISNLVDLNILDAGNTFISGLIPESIGKLGNLVKLNLRSTGLSGQIPSTLGNLSNLISLQVDHANLQGPIPASIGSLKNLLALDLSMNHLNGSIPEEIFKLPVLSTYLNLSYNSLSGSLPSEIGRLANLNNLFLSGNQLSGRIPDSIGECTVLQRLWLDNNSFEGSIPQSLKDLRGLSELKLSMNNLSGTIPDTIGGIRNLQQLYLDHNNLSGPIPTVLQNLESLSELDLSFNNLQGKVPNEGIFRNLANFSITGNGELCGGIPQLHLDPCHTNSDKKNGKVKLEMLRVLLATSALLVLAIAITLIMLSYKKLKRKERSLFLPPMLEEQYCRVSYHALAHGTNGFSEANLLGKGSFGEVYKCTFQDEGNIVAVKIFNLQQSRSTRTFVAECEALRTVRHRSIIRIITCCSSLDHRGQEFRALVFEFMPNGSLDGWLHRESVMATLKNTLSLQQRLDIAVDVIDALDYLHNHCYPPIVHCDLKPSNILLAEDMSARVGDFGISRILPESASYTLQSLDSTTGIRGSIGYIAPEYGEGSSISILGDVYSLGILLLEMFTGRSPTNNMFGGSYDLHKFSEDALPERIWDISDTTMWLHTGIYDNTTRSRIENCLVSVIALGISCSKRIPSERTLIQDAAVTMLAIRDSYLKVFGRSPVVEHGATATDACKSALS